MVVGRGEQAEGAADVARGVLLSLCQWRDEMVRRHLPTDRPPRNTQLTKGGSRQNRESDSHTSCSMFHSSILPYSTESDPSMHSSESFLPCRVPCAAVPGPPARRERAIRSLRPRPPSTGCREALHSPTAAAMRQSRRQAPGGRRRVRGGTPGRGGGGAPGGTRGRSGSRPRHHTRC